jgi:N6-L-threonylcarbamoyladenine synthase
MLGIETSCDETAAAVVEEIGSSSVGPLGPRWVLRSNVVASQADIHREWGGVVPELASRQHVRDICGVVERALEQAGTRLDEIDGIAVTEGPGLVGSLLVGVRSPSLSPPRASYRSCRYTIWPGTSSRCSCRMARCAAVGRARRFRRPHEPVSGHGAWCLPPARANARRRRGRGVRQRCQAAGTGLSGRPIVDRLARQGNDRAIDLPLTRITHADRNAPQLPGRLDFSYSGLKTAVLRHVESRKAGGAWPPSDQEVADLCASFQRVVVESLLDRLFAAAEQYGAASAGIAGGVSANSRLRADALARGEKVGLPVYIPSLALSTETPR